VRFCSALQGIPLLCTKKAFSQFLVLLDEPRGAGSYKKPHGTYLSLAGNMTIRRMNDFRHAFSIFFRHEKA
jgi:hypothetical protein